MTRIDFEGVVEAADRGGAMVRLPADAAETFGTRARFPVSVTFNGIPYRGSTMPMGDGTFCVGILKAIRAEAGLGIGDKVHVTLERDDGERRVEVPEELAAALERHPAAQQAYHTMSFTHRREYAEWVGEAKKDKTKQRLAAKTIETILGRAD